MLRIIKRTFAALLLLSLNFNEFGYIKAQASQPSKPNVAAESAILMDANTGKVLYEKNSGTKQYPASITKIMTALLVAEKANMSDMVTYSATATTNLESGAITAGVSAGDVISVRDSLYALMLRSANEVGNGLAEHVGGSMYTFSTMMTARAKELGAKNTNFTNAHGLNDTNHYTTAYDMALIAKAAYANALVLEVSSSMTYTFPATKKTGKPTQLNMGHKMLQASDARYYKDVVAGKTGYTRRSGNTLVSYAVRGNRKLIAVILKSNQTHYTDTKALLDYGFALNYKDEVPVNSNVNNNTAVPASKESKSQSEARIEDRTRQNEQATGAGGPSSAIRNLPSMGADKKAIVAARRPDMEDNSSKASDVDAPKGPDSKPTRNIWKKDDKGWYYIKKDGNYAKSELLKIDNQEYWFDDEGYMDTGWLQDVSGAWFYFSEDGSMRKSAWIEYNTKWYYLLDTGIMLTSGTTPDGYKVDSEGVWIK